MRADRAEELLDELRRELADRYTVEGELGRGAMARVYRARDLAGQRTVALKVLPPELAPATNAERFLREVRITTELRHPNILPLLDSGVTGTHYWYVMPLVEGDSLGTMLKTRGPLAVPEALALAAEVTAALGYAHSRGVVHRDLKPENLMRSAGRWVVLDFGLARAIESDTRLTGTGMPLGTPAYMSPEQITGAAEVDARADLYGFACVLYEALTGRPPFVGPTVVQLLRAHLTQTPAPPSTVRPGLPASLDGPILKALAKDPARRQAGAEALAEELAHAAPVADGPVQEPPRRGLLRRLFGRADG